MTNIISSIHPEKRITDEQSADKSSQALFKIVFINTHTAVIQDTAAFLFFCFIISLYIKTRFPLDCIPVRLLLKDVI